MNSSDLKKPGDFFTTDGNDIWELMHYAMQPSCSMKNLKTGEVESFAMGGITAEGFHRLDTFAIDPKDDPIVLRAAIGEYVGVIREQKKEIEQLTQEKENG